MNNDANIAGHLLSGPVVNG